MANNRNKKKKKKSTTAATKPGVVSALHDYDEYDSWEGGYYTAGTTVATRAQCIKDVIDNSNQGVILIDHRALQNLFQKSGANAKSNEFQTHYWSLNYRYTAEDGSRVDICIPTTYFNYEQTVSSAHIDFMLSDVTATSTKVQPIHNMKVNELKAAGVKEKLEAILNVELEEISVELNSIHRHPGGSARQGFSSTDLSKNRADLGVVFPLEEASGDTANFAGIMAIDAGVCNMAHYEYRVANGKLDDGGITYEQGRCAALVANTPPPSEPAQPSFVEQLFGIPPKAPIVHNYDRYKNCEENEVFTAIKKMFEELNFEADTTVVVADFVKTRVYTPTYSRPTMPRTNTAVQNAKPAARGKVSDKEFSSANFELKKLKDLEVYTKGQLMGMSSEQLKETYENYLKDYGAPRSSTAPKFFYAFVNEIMDMQEDKDIDIADAEETIAAYNKQKEATKSATKPAVKAAAQPGNAAKTTVENLPRKDFYDPRTMWYKKLAPVSVKSLTFEESVRYCNELRHFYKGHKDDFKNGEMVVPSAVVEEIFQLQRSIEKEIEEAVKRSGLVSKEQKISFLISKGMTMETLQYAGDSSLNSWVTVLGDY